MMRFLTVRCLPLLILPVLAACSKEDEPPPPFNTVLSNGSEALPPVVLARPDAEGLPPVSSVRYLKKIGGPAGNPAEVSIDKAAATPADGARAITLNDAEAEPLMKQFVELVNAGNYDATVAMVVPDQQPVVRKVAAAATALTKNLARLRAVLKDAAADVVKQLQPDEKGAILLKMEDGTEFPIVVTPSGLEVVGVTPEGADKATATIRAAGSAVEKKFEMEKIEGKWRIREPNIPSTPEAVAAEVAMSEAAAKAFGEVADKVEKNEILPTDVMNEIVAALKRAVEAAKNARPEAADASGQGSNADPSGNAANSEQPKGDASAQKTSKRKPGETLSGRDVNNDAPTLEESLGRQ